MPARLIQESELRLPTTQATGLAYRRSMLVPPSPVQEATGGLDDSQLRALAAQLAAVDRLEEQRSGVLSKLQKLVRGPAGCPSRLALLVMRQRLCRRPAAASPAAFSSLEARRNC